MAKHSVQSRCFTKEVEEEVWELLCIIPVAWAMAVQVDDGFGASRWRWLLSKNAGGLLKGCIFEKPKIHNYLINSFDWHDLAQEWRNHKFSYGDKTENTTNRNMPIGLQNNWMLSKAFGPIKKIYTPTKQNICKKTVDLIHVSTVSKRLSITFLNPWMIWFF
jgi:hypothetical protein